MAVLLMQVCMLNVQGQSKTAVSSPPIDSITLYLVRDLAGTIPLTKDVKVAWELTRDGYKGTYAVSNLDYMTWYDLEGNYLLTLLKTAWDDRVPAIVKMEFGNSEFNACSILTYWERINTNHPDYYFEMEDRDGKTLYVWADENGNFSKVPVFMR